MKSKFPLTMSQKLKVVFTFTMFAYFFADACAQGVGINTSSPDSSAALDIQSSKQGLLIPRVNLTSLTDALTIIKPSHSLLVWNINAALASGEGYYFNSGTSAIPNWIGIQANPNAIWDGKIAFKVSGVPLGSETIQPNTAPNIGFSHEDYDLGNNFNGNVFTVPVNGIYHFDALVHFGNTKWSIPVNNDYDAPLHLKQIRNGVTTNIDMSLPNYAKNSTNFWNHTNIMHRISADVRLNQGDQISLTLGFYPNPNQDIDNLLFIFTDNLATRFNGRLVSVLPQ